MKECPDTIVVGGGQAGLAVSYYLTQQGHSHVVLEQSSQPANAWRNQRWDSFTFVTPKWMTRLPGAEHHGADLDGFMSRSEIVAFFEQYVERFKLPLRYGVQVTAIKQDPGSQGYTLRTSKGIFQSANVVIATGLFQKPKIPIFSTEFPPEITQLHSQLMDGYDAELIHKLELTGIQSVIWATGFMFDFSLVRLPVSDADGYPIQTRGITKYAGLYFVGLPWIHSAKSGLLFGVGEDAAFIAANIEARSKKSGDHP